MFKNVLEVKNLTKKFGNFTAVDNISFEIKDGEILGLLGQNGAGKTTTIQMLLNLMEPTAGEISYFGKNFKNHREEILKQVNFSSTYISLPSFFTVDENLDVFARLYQIPDKKKRIDKLLQEFEIDHLRKRQYFMLSAGERTRLLLTKAFLNYPKVILLDEPTSSLDPDIAVKIRKFLIKERDEYNVSVLLTSHNMAEIEEMCDRVMVIKSGNMIASGTPADLTKTISECTIELNLDDLQKAVVFFNTKKINFEINKSRFKIKIDEKKIAELLTRLAYEKIGYSEISIFKPDLEDFFLNIVTNKND
jgi:ABC-2 type transport system ATP-binding protein